jgi:hypothetical protein
MSSTHTRLSTGRDWAYLAQNEVWFAGDAWKRDRCREEWRRRKELQSPDGRQRRGLE